MIKEEEENQRFSFGKRKSEIYMDLVIVCTYQCGISIIFFLFFFIGLDLNFVFSFTTLNSKQYYSKFKDHWEN